ncbi:MAG TPA: hypothetical protein P5119_13580 [Candidatus Aminicenantes bacterium]|nr:hypothetical protein [Candidatus Aminicenantes bacterium]HRY66356.1 hypothetical protein [Candidatus Aminicenantes bacterium]HRZ72597.1 hypothetical protein [Candidatus Aminicenantes bacterium]
MKTTRSVGLTLAFAVLFASFGALLASAGDGRQDAKPAKIKLPKNLYCAMTPTQDRYSINLRPLTKALGQPAETWEVQLFRNDHLVTSLGMIGGGQELKEFILFTLPPVDADAFNSVTATSAERAGGADEQVGMGIARGTDGREDILRSKTGRNFELRVFDAAGGLLAKKKILLLLN